MNKFDNYTEEQLLAELADCISMEGEAKAQAKPYRSELLSRQCETGLQSVTHEGWQSVLSRQPFSLSWLKREYGYDEADLPRECIKQRTVTEIDWDAVISWLGQDGLEVPPTYTLRVSRVKTKE